MPDVSPTSRAARRAAHGRWRVVPSLVALGLAATIAGHAQAQQSFDIAMRDGLLSIRANGAPAASLAEALASETGIRFVVTGDASRAISTEIVDEPLDRAIAKLSPNHLLVRDGERADAPLVEVVLMLDDTDGDAGGGGTEFLPSGAPADEIDPGEADGLPNAEVELTEDGVPVGTALEGAADTMRALLRSREESGLAVGEELSPDQQVPLEQ